MKKYLFLSALIGLVCNVYAQTVNPEAKFSPQQLKTDLAFLKQQIFDAHAYPYTELSQAQYEKLFAGIDASLTDSATATSFYKLVKPTVAYLSDEHAGISLDSKLQTRVYQTQAVFLPISLAKRGNNYIVGELLASNTGLQKGEVITQIDGTPVTKLLQQCASYTTGFKNQRGQKALLQFGYLYTWFAGTPAESYTITTDNGNKVVKGIGIQPWVNFITLKVGLAEHYEQMIAYTRYNNAGYIDTRSFDIKSDAQFDSLRSVVANIFKQVKSDGVKYLFIDVSKNGGGNSEVGDLLIDYFYNKPYRTYQCNWKRSDEYLAKIKSWGIRDDNYAAKPIGTIIHSDAGTRVPDNTWPNRFNGKVYLIVGDGTFSSAIMFATVVKDNNLATLVGQVPQNGHPNHFGEMYDAKLPNTKIDIRFGVKEWIRPAGKSKENILYPDIPVNLERANSPQAVIGQVIK